MTIRIAYMEDGAAYPVATCEWCHQLIDEAGMGLWVFLDPTEDTVNTGRPLRPITVDLWTVHKGQCDRWWEKQVAAEHGRGIGTMELELLPAMFARNINFQKWKLLVEAFADVDDDETGLVSPRTRFNVLKRDQYQCQICGRKTGDGVSLHVDHKVPRARGGEASDANLWTLCSQCNLGKGAESL